MPATVDCVPITESDGSLVYVPRPAVPTLSTAFADSIGGFVGRNLLDRPLFTLFGSMALFWLWSKAEQEERKRAAVRKRGETMRLRKLRRPAATRKRPEENPLTGQ